MSRSVISPELTEGVEEPHVCPKPRLRVHAAATSQLQVGKRTLLALDSLMGNRRVMFQCHKQRGLMHSLVARAQMGRKTSFLPKVSVQNWNRTGGRGRQAASLARQ